MRLTENENEELKDIMLEGFPVLEHTGGDGWTLLHGDTLSIVRAFKPGVFDAVITDPPYASGGAKPSEKNRTTTQKYSSMRADKALPDFDGDQKDQRSWTRWMAEWLSDVRKACKAGAVLCVFIDWRMAPCLSDAIQWAGWIWRGQVVWDKMTSRPQKGRYRQQSHRPSGGMSAGRVPVHEPGQTHPRDGEAVAAHAGYRAYLCAGRTYPRPVRGSGHDHPCRCAGRV